MKSKKVGMKSTPPGVKTSNNQKKPGGGHKVVGTDGKPINPEPEKPKGAEPALDPRISCMGNFAVPQGHIYSKFEEVQEFMKDVVIIRAEMQMTPQGNIVVYTGISPKYFAPVANGQMVPQYNVARRIDGVYVVTPAGRPMPSMPPVPPK